MVEPPESRRKRRHEDEYSSSKKRDKRDRRDDDRDRHSSRHSQSQRRSREKERSSTRNEDDNHRRAEPPSEQEKLRMQDALKANQELYNAQQRISEMRRKIASSNISAPLPPPSQAPMHKSLNANEAAAYADLIMSAPSKIKELRDRVEATRLLIQQKTEDEKPGAAELIKKEPEPVPEVIKEEEDVGIIDSRISMRGPQRGRRATFKFVKPGEYQREANIQRNTARLNILQSEIETTAKQTGISTAVKLALVTPDVDQGSSTNVPTIEWWDEIVLNATAYDEVPSKDLPIEQRYTKTITSLIEHPIQLKAPDEPLVPPVIKVYLTKKERKKLRRQNRRELQKEQTEKIRLGLEPPPEPKVKIGNLMRVLGADAIQDPTKMEAHVREQMANRVKKHMQANAERKLTKEERSEKRQRKYEDDTSLSVNVTVYRVKSLANQSKKFKVETNAKQLGMTGCIIIYKDINLVVVEGGPKQQKFYKNLMLNRIKWEEEVIGRKNNKKPTEDEEEEDDDHPRQINECTLVWEGIVKNRAFHDIRVQILQSPKQIRDLLEKHGISHYWDHAYSTSVLTTEEAEDSS